MERRAKIVATVGPKSWSERQLSRLMKAGMDVARLNLSHGERDDHRQAIRRIRAVAEGMGRFVAVVADLQGPRYRLGEMSGEVTLKKGQKVTLGARSGADIPLADRDILKHVQAGERFLIGDGLIELQVQSKSDGLLHARVRAGGKVSSRKGINLPDSDLPFRVSTKDRLDIAMAVEESADYLAASYVGRGRDVEQIRKLTRKLGSDLPIIAKLERVRAVTHLDEIIESSDAVMVARGDLGVEVPLHRVPVLQKQIIGAGWRLGKPVVVATQMLESMVSKPRPTRAESTDVANAVFDGADALMLSGETAVGRYPIVVVRTMDRIIREAESHQLQGVRSSSGLSQASASYDIEPPATDATLEIPETIAAAAVQSSRQLAARRIVALTGGGFTVRMLARRRPSTPIIALTQNASTARGLQLVWGVRPLWMNGAVEHHDEVVGLVDRHLLEARLAKAGDTVAILMGDPIRLRPPTNLLRIHRVLRGPVPIDSHRASEPARKTRTTTRPKAAPRSSAKPRKKSA